MERGRRVRSYRREDGNGWRKSSVREAEFEHLSLEHTSKQAN